MFVVLLNSGHVTNERALAKFVYSFAEIAMGLFKKVQEVLCLCLMEEIIDEEEFVLLYEAYRPSNPPFLHSAYEKFSLANKDPAERKALHHHCKAIFVNCKFTA